ncbi:MAG: hypothetical protein DRI61_06590 [Chloroflexi bacterium]|nr:MAG: hypothetical protein DRI61_06590 [Chloroflexota bacterium]
MTKAEILTWHERAKNRLDLRKQGRIKGWPMCEADHKAYSASISRELKRMKKEFNRRFYEKDNSNNNSSSTTNNSNS